jgi:hygromycin-B 4-O-kinase
MNRKPSLTIEEVGRLLAAQGMPVTDLAPMKEGLQSQAFACSLDGFPAVLRINRTIRDFEKDRFAYEHFRSERLPIPRVLEIGWLDDAHAFCLSERLPGVMAQTVDAATAGRLAAPTFDCWRAMAATDVSFTTGFGEFDGEGNAFCDSWQAYLLEDVGLDWSPIPDVDLALIRQIGAAIARLAPLCPNERHLIHCDFGADNLLTDGEAITGVLDWALAGYGDPLFDVASGHFWGYWKVTCLSAFAAYCDAQLKDEPNYSERLLCYELFQARGNIHYYWHRDNAKTARLIEERGRELLVEAAKL